MLLLVTLPPTVQALFNFKKETRTPLQKEYDLLDRLLVEHLPGSNSTVDNLMLASSWLPIVNGEVNGTIEAKNLPNKDAIQTFTSLLQLADDKDPRCDIEAFKIVEANAQACGVNFDKPSKKLSSTRRIEDVINQIATKHAQSCRSEYPDKLDKSLEGADKSKFDELIGILKAVIRSSFIPDVAMRRRNIDKQTLRALKSKKINWLDREAVVAVLAHLNEKIDPNEVQYLHRLPEPKQGKRWLVDEAHIKMVLEKHLFSNCNYMLEYLNPVIRPAMVDKEFFDEAYRYKVRDKQTGTLMLYIRYFSMCKQLIDHDRAEVEKKALKIIRDEKLER